MKREQQTNNREDVLTDVGDSLREWTPSSDEERGALDRVWSGLRWKAKQVPGDVVRSVELGPALSERRRVEEPQVARWTRRSTVRAVAAAAMVIVAVGGAMVWPRGARVYAAGADGLQVTLADDSSVEMRAHSEMTVERASDGIQIDLKTGDIIVTAADRRDGHLYVRTKDMTIALSTVARGAKVDVDGTVFLASAGQQGSRVGVIEGEVRVREGDVETLVRPGEQLSTRPTIAQRPLAEDITWSRNKDAHLRVIDSFTRAIAQTSGSLSSVGPANQRQRDTSAAGSPRPEFEEASIRECDLDNLPAAVPGARGGGGSNAFYMTPGRFYALCMTPATLIRSAYGYYSVAQEVELGRLTSPQAPGRMLPVGAGSVYNAPAEDGQRVRGGPDWLRTEKYTIEAVAGSAAGDAASMTLLPGVAPHNQPDAVRANAATMSGPMLLALLERRFGLKAHIVTEQAQAFSLVVAPGGLKMKEGACTPSEQRQRGEEALARWLVDVVRRNLDAARRGDATTGFCGFGLADNGPNRIFVGAGAGLPPLEGTLGEFVTNRTGIPDTRRFNYALEFLRDGRTRTPYFQILPRDPDLRIAADPSSVQPAPDLFTALEQQLGLRLEPERVPRDYIVIDAIRRLEPN